MAPIKDTTKVLEKQVGGWFGLVGGLYSFIEASERRAAEDECDGSGGGGAEAGGNEDLGS